MAAIRQIFLICLLAIAAECYWPWHRPYNHFEHLPRKNHHLQDLPSLYPLNNFPYDDIIKSMIQDEISNYDVIRKRITVTKKSKFYDDEFFPGFTYEAIAWWNSVPEEIVEDSDSDLSEDSDESGDIEVFINNANNQDIGVDNNIGDFDKLVLDNGDSNSDLSLHSNDSGDNSFDAIGDKNNQKPFVNNFKPDVHADEDIEIDPRKDEE